MDQNLKLKRENSDGSGYLHEKHGTLSLPQDPAPSSPLLQGERGSSRSSSELSSSEGVWLVRKGEKVREKERKCERVGRPESFRPKNFINEEASLQCHAWGLLQTIPSTKLPNDQNKHYYNGGKSRRQTKSDKKKSKSQKQDEQWNREGNFAGCEISHPAKYSQPAKIFCIASFSLPFLLFFPSNF